MKIYAITGGPATGKDTRGDILSNELGVPHISTGALLRKFNESSATGEKANIDNGLHAPDDIVTELLYNRISMPDCTNGFILNGYPRNVDQILLLENMFNELGFKLNGVVELVVPINVAFERILSRKECPKCNKTYGNLIKPQVDGICDCCGTQLTMRNDDTEETLRTRINIHIEKTEPTINYYREKGLLITIDASGQPEKILDIL
ncbi:MAG: adenylate kinase [Clostridia bacterium]|jgi:adenylate kinase|nr:adenylate kinase [Clostridia bacterium]